MDLEQALADARLTRESLMIAKRDIEALEAKLRQRDEAVRNATCIIDEYLRERLALQEENNRLRRLLARNAGGETTVTPARRYRWGPPV